VTSQTTLYRALVRDAMGTDYGMVAADASCADAVAALCGHDGTCVVVTDGARRPVGILTEQDVARRITFQVAEQSPVQLAFWRHVHHPWRHGHRVKRK
jgi:predicted transcriptional regulator